jgi:2'-5' RNA ligase
MDEQNHKHLFIGIPVDDHCQQQINATLQSLQQSRKDIRWVTPANRHLTLAFLGDISAEDSATLQKNFADAYQGTSVFNFSLDTLGRFPSTRGRILAATNKPSVALSILHNKTLALLRRCNITVEPLEFRPHISLGKIQHAKHVSEDFQQTTALLLKVHCVNLYESRPQDEGRLYNVLQQARFSL